MPGLVTAGVKLVSIADTQGFKQFSKGLREMRLDFLGLEQVASIVDQMSQSLLRLGKFGAGAIGATVKEAVDLNAVMTQVVSIQTSLAPEIGALTARFQELSNELPLSATELAETAVQAARAGIEVPKALEAIALTSAKLASITDSLTEANATKALVTIAKIYGTSTDDMADQTLLLGDQFARLERVGLATAGAIAEAATSAAGAAQAFGLSETQLLGLSAAAINTGSSAGVAGTAIQNLLLKVSANTAKVSNAVGISTKRFREMINEGKGIAALREFLVKLKTPSEGVTRSSTDMAEALKAAGIGGKKLGGLVLKLAGNINFLDEAMKATGDASGVLEERFVIASQAIQKQFDTLIGSIKNVAAQFGETLFPIIRGVIKVLLVFTSILLKIPAPIKFLMVVIAILVTGLVLLVGGLLAAVAMVAAMATGAIFMGKTIMSAGRSFKSLRSEVNAASFAMLRLQAIQKRGVREPGLAGRTRLKSDIAGAKGNIGSGALFGGVAVSIAKGKTALAGFATKAGGVITKIAGFISVELIAVILALSAIVIALKDDFADVFDAVSSLAEPFKVMGKRMGEFSDAITGSGGFNVIAAFFGTLRVLMFPIVLFLKAVAFGFRGLSTLLVSFVNAVFNGFSPLIKVFERFRLGLSRIGDRFMEMATGLGLVSDQGEEASSVFDTMGKVFDFIFKSVTFTMSILSEMMEVGLGIIFGVLEGFTVALDPLFVALMDLKDTFVEIFHVFAAMFQPVIDLWTELFGGADEATEAFDTFGVTIQFIAAAVRLLMQFIIIPLRILIFMIKVLAIILAVVFAPFFIVMTGIVVIVLLIVKLFKFLGNSISEFFSLFSGSSSFATTLKFLFEAIGESFSNMLDSVIDGIMSALGVIGDAIRAVFRIFTGGPEGVVVKPPTAEQREAAAEVSLRAANREKIISAKRAFLEMQAGRSGVSREGVGSGAASAAGGEALSVATQPIVVQSTLMLDNKVVATSTQRIAEQRNRQAFGTRSVPLAGR